ncbi:hypothetical protein HID58_038933 [Brassica napus]|uniref:Uncharacterized protein n=1 Tax=Brassica napus TaxID=3708 RepID=A0ABQ8BQM1_BRANA|nr:hypothetical protein HID58_038933 [Brassica napus]
MEKVTENPNFETKNLPPPNHQMDADDDDENVKQLKECSSLNLSLQDCLVDSNRDWKPYVQALKACHERRTKKW